MAPMLSSRLRRALRSRCAFTAFAGGASFRHDSAREAEPDALLTYEEFGLEDEDAASLHKRVAVLQLLRRQGEAGSAGRCRPAGASHRRRPLRPGLDGVFGRGAGALLQVFISELEVNDRNLPADPVVRDAAVARVYADFVGPALHEPAVSVVMT